MQQTIQWFPGHMTRTKRKITQLLPLIDIVVEVVDARIPQSSRNPDLDSLLSAKPRMIVLNKADIACSQSEDVFADIRVSARTGEGLCARSGEDGPRAGAGDG